jgi:hypothetical protein
VSGWEWRRWLAASLWYSGEVGEGVGSALYRYDNLVASGSAPAPEPAYVAYQARRKELPAARKRKEGSSEASLTARTRFDAVPLVVRF